MASTYKRVLVEIDSVKFHPVEARYVCSRTANQVGRRIGESLQAKASIFVDAHDSSNIAQGAIIELWKMATESKDPLHKVSITYYADDGDKVVGNVEFSGWVSTFEFFNPATMGPRANFSGLNNVLLIEMTVSLDEQNVSKHKFTS